MDKTKQFLADPNICGEDLLALANRAFVLAPQLCGDCATYHIRIPATRAVGMGRGLELDRHLVIDALKGALVTQEINNRKNPTIAIIGSADTGLFATCAHAAISLGSEFLKRTKFIVADICPTPLAMCAEFAATHGLNLQTIKLDFENDTFEPEADIIFLHSILRFISIDHQASLLRKLGEKLRSGGKLIISNHLKRDGENNSPQIDRRREITGVKILELAQSGELQTHMDFLELDLLLKKSLLASKSRKSATPSLESSLTLFERAGLRCERAEKHVLQGSNEAMSINTERLIAVLTK